MAVSGIVVVAKRELLPVLASGYAGLRYFGDSGVQAQERYMLATKLCTQESRVHECEEV